jgi:hypothetical protein
METTKNVPMNKGDPAAVERPKPNHTAKIKFQVLAKIGQPSRLGRIEVSKHHNGKYRINIWQQPEPDKNIAVTASPRIGLSYYLTVSDTGEIVQSNPPLAKLGSST